MAVLYLDPLRLGDGRPQAHGDVVGDVVAAQCEHRRVADGAVVEHGDVRGAPADVHEDDPELGLVGGQDGGGGRDLLEHDVLEPQAGFLGALGDVAHGGDGTRDDVHVGLELGARHAHGVGDAVHVVHAELLGQHVDHLHAHGLGEVHGLVHHPLLVGGGDLLALHGDDRARGDPLDVAAGDPRVHLVHPDARHLLRVFHRVADGLHGLLHVHHEPAPQALGLGDAEADDLEVARFLELRDDAADLGGADVEPDDDPIPGCHSAPDSLPRFCFHRSGPSRSPRRA